MTFVSAIANTYRLLVEALPAAIVITDTAGAIRFVNAETLHMFDYRAEELLGQAVDILLPAPARALHAGLRRGYLASPSSRAMGAGRELKARRRNGAEFPVEIGLTPLGGKDSLMVLATVLDITTRKQTEDALAQSLADLQTANERLTQFAYVTAYDLQEPLRKIEAFSGDLDKAIAASDKAGILHASHTMRTSALGARKLVEDLLTYARTIYGELQLEIVDLREEVRFALAGLAQPIVETHAQMNVDLPTAIFLADRAQFVYLMQNIIRNGIKYHKRGQAPKIDIGATVAGDSGIRLTIVDNGVGFKEEFARLIFEPVKRTYGAAEYPASGIELAICKSIADRHGWQISVKSKPGEGTTFAFIIPSLLATPAPGPA